jgi:hypothetical protein
MGRSQVLFNRSKGRFRSRVRQQTQQEEGRQQHQHVSPTIREEEEKLEDDVPSQKRSKSISETDILLLAESKPQYYEDDTTTVFGDVDKSVMSSTSYSASSLDITSLETTLLTCMTMSQRLKIPSHVAQTLQSQEFLSLTTKHSAAAANDKILSYSIGAQPPPHSAPSAPSAPSNGRERERGWLPAAPSHDFQSSKEHFLLQQQQDVDDASYSIGPNKIRTTEGGDIEVRIKQEESHKKNKKNRDDASLHSREYDVDRYAALEDEYPEEDEEDEEDEDSFTTTTQGNITPPVPSSILHPSKKIISPSIIPKTKDKVASFAKSTMDPPSYYYRPQQLQQQRQQPIEPSTTAAPDDSILEDWLDSVTASNLGESDSPALVPVNSKLDEVASKLGLPSAPRMPTTPTNSSSGPVPAVDNVSLASSSSLSTITRSTAMPQEVSFPQTNQRRTQPPTLQKESKTKSAPKNTTVIPPIPGGAGVDSLDAWLDDVIS